MSALRQKVLEIGPSNNEKITVVVAVSQKWA